MCALILYCFVSAHNIDGPIEMFKVNSKSGGIFQKPFFYYLKVCILRPDNPLYFSVVMRTYTASSHSHFQLFKIQFLPFINLKKNNFTKKKLRKTILCTYFKYALHITRTNKGKARKAHIYIHFYTIR